MIVIVLGTSIALSGLAQLVGRKILGPAAGRETGAARIFLSPPLLLKTLFERVEAALGGTYLALLIIALCLAAMCLSFVLSVRFYRRRDL
jgi:hypothetical protein